MPKYDKVFFSQHYFENKKKKRPYLSKEKVLKVLADPTNELPANKKGRKKFRKKINGSKYYTVILKESKDGKAAYIITAHRKK